MSRPTSKPAVRPARHPALLAWLRLAHLNGVILRGADKRLRRRGLTVAEFDILAHVGAAPGATQHALSERLLVTEGNVTYQLGKLERRGLLERKPGGRCKYLYLTEEGKTLVQEIVPEQEAWHIEQFSILSEDEQRQLLGLLRKLEHGQPQTR